MLLVSGVGRNSGKTSLVCKVIGDFQSKFEITAIKISPHLHYSAGNSDILVSNNNFVISRETTSNSGKDSAKFLLAGAKPVFFLQVKDIDLQEAWLELAKYLSPKKLIICEGGWLRSYAEPGISVLCDIFNTGHKKDPGTDTEYPIDFFLNENPDRFLSKLSVTPELHWKLA